MARGKKTEIPTKKTFMCLDCGHRYTIKMARKRVATLPKYCKNCSR
jgi:hypothetical protein